MDLTALRDTRKGAVLSSLRDLWRLLSKLGLKLQSHNQRKEESLHINISTTKHIYIYNHIDVFYLYK